MEKFEHAPQESQSTEKEPQSTEEAVSCFLNGDNNAAVSYLRNNRDEIGEFCLQVRDAYQEHDTTTPFLELAQLIDSLL